MKRLLTVLAVLVFVNAKAQFHVQVEANPDNKGDVNISWINNYVVFYTNDNWKTKAIIKAQLTYMGYDDNGKVFYTSYYDKVVFQKQNQAIRFAKNFKAYSSILNWDMKELKNHVMLTEQYNEEKKKLCFGCKDRKNEKSQPVKVF